MSKNKQRSRKPLVNYRRLIRRVASIILITLGSHGIYCWASKVETMWTGRMDCLYLVIDMPSELQGIIAWMSFKGLESWFIPTAFLVGGVLLWRRKLLL